MDNKNPLTKVLKETIVDESGNGSSKRSTAFYFTVVLVTSLHVLLFISSLRGIDMNQTLRFFLVADLLYLCAVNGLTSVDKIFCFFTTLRGIRNEKPAETPVPGQPVK